MSSFPFPDCTPAPTGERYGMGHVSGELPGLSLFNSNQTLIVSLIMREGYLNSIPEPPPGIDAGLFLGPNFVRLNAAFNQDEGDVRAAHVYVVSVPSPRVTLPTHVHITSVPGIGILTAGSRDRCEWIRTCFEVIKREAIGVNVYTSVPDGREMRESVLITNATTLVPHGTVSDVGVAALKVDWFNEPWESVAVYGLDAYDMQVRYLAQSALGRENFLQTNVFRDIDLSAAVQYSGADAPSKVQIGLQGIAVADGAGVYPVQDTTEICDTLTHEVVLYFGLISEISFANDGFVILRAQSTDGGWDNDPDAVPPHVSSLYVQGQEGPAGGFVLDGEARNIIANEEFAVLVDDPQCVDHIVGNVRALRSYERLLCPIPEVGDTQVFVRELKEVAGSEFSKKKADEASYLLSRVVDAVSRSFGCNSSLLQTANAFTFEPLFATRAVELAQVALSSCGNAAVRDLGTKDTVSYRMQVFLGGLTCKNQPVTILGEEVVIDDPPEPIVTFVELERDRGRVPTTPARPSRVPFPMESTPATDRKGKNEEPGQIPGPSESPILPVQGDRPVDDAVFTDVDDYSDDDSSVFGESLSTRRIDQRVPLPEGFDDLSTNRVPMDIVDVQEQLQDFNPSIFALSARARPTPELSNQAGALSLNATVVVRSANAQGTRVVVRKTQGSTLDEYARPIYNGLSETHAFVHRERVRLIPGRSGVVDGEVHGCISTETSVDVSEFGENTPAFVWFQNALSGRKADVFFLDIVARTTRSAQLGEKAAYSTKVFAPILGGPGARRGTSSMGSFPVATPMKGPEVIGLLGNTHAVPLGLASHVSSDDVYILSTNSYDACIDTVVVGPTSRIFSPFDSEPSSHARLSLAAEIAGVGVNGVTLPRSGSDTYRFTSGENVPRNLGRGDIVDLFEKLGVALSPRAVARLPPFTAVRIVSDADPKVIKIKYGTDSALVVIASLLLVATKAESITFTPETWLGRMKFLSALTSGVHTTSQARAVRENAYGEAEPYYVMGAVQYIAEQFAAFVAEDAKERTSLVRARAHPVFNQNDVWRNINQDTFDAAVSLSDTTIAGVEKAMRTPTRSLSSVTPWTDTTFNTAPLVSGEIPAFTYESALATVMEAERVRQTMSLAGTMRWKVEHSYVSRGIARCDITSKPIVRGSSVDGPASFLFDDFFFELTRENNDLDAKIAAYTAAPSAGLPVEIVQHAAKVVLFVCYYGALQNYFLDFDVRQSATRRQRQQMGTWTAPVPDFVPRVKDYNERMLGIMEELRENAADYFENINPVFFGRNGDFDEILTLSGIFEGQEVTELPRSIERLLLWKNYEGPPLDL